MPYTGRYNEEEGFDYYDSSDEEREEWDYYDEPEEEYNDLGDSAYDYMEEDWQEYLNSPAYVATEFLESVNIPTFVIDQIIDLSELQFY